MRPLSPSEAEVLRLLLRDADVGMSFTQLRGYFPGGISQRGLANALKELERSGTIEKSVSVRSKGAHWNYRISHPAPEEILISDVVNFLKEEPAERSYTGVLWMGLIASSDKRFGQVLNEDQDYNKKFLELFLSVHEKWRNRIASEYESSGRIRDLAIVRRYEHHLLECLRLYKAPIYSPFTKATIVINDLQLLHYNILEQSQIMRGMVPPSRKHLSYCDFVLWWLKFMEEKKFASEAVQKMAESHKAYLYRKSAKKVYESFLSRIVPPQSVLFVPFGFNSPVQRGVELMTRFTAALQRKSKSSLAAGLPNSVWYGGYGSNLDLARFRCYLEGTPPFKGAPSPDEFPGEHLIADMGRGEFNFKLFFAYRHSETWGDGGVAFIETEPSTSSPTLMRLFKLTIPQLAWVVKGENDLDEPPSIGSRDLEGLSRIICDHGRYRLLLRCGELDGLPIVTLTGDPNRTDRNALRPSPRYLAKMRSGLHQTFPEMSYPEIDKYLEARMPAPQGDET
jgi:hypothetical protein